VGKRAQIRDEMDCLPFVFSSMYFYSYGSQVMDFNEPEDSFMDVVCKLLILFMTVLIALLIGWIIGKI
jgi:hypothetical protein